MIEEAVAARLSQAGFSVIDRWATRDVLDFVRGELDSMTWPLRAFWVYFGIQVVVLLGLATAGFAEADGAWISKVAGPIGAGFLGLLLLLMPHELLHGLAYRISGAPYVRYGADWRRLVFHAAAPGFVIGRRAMTFVALLPLGVLSMLVIGLALWVEGSARLAAVAALVAHTQGCLGDVAMVNYFARSSNGGEVVTYDEESGEAFVFLVRNRPT